MLKYFEKLKEAVLRENLFETEEILNYISENDSAFEYIRPILELMENYPELDYGMPGPLVHFMEAFYGNGYEDLLLYSIRRKPTMHTLWMANRVLNLENDCKKSILITLKNALEREDLDEEIKNEIKKCLEMHG